MESWQWGQPSYQNRHMRSKHCIEEIDVEPHGIRILGELVFLFSCLKDRFVMEIAVGLGQMMRAKWSQQWWKKECQSWELFKFLAFSTESHIRRLEINFISSKRNLSHYLSTKKYLVECHQALEESSKDHAVKCWSWKNQVPRLILLSINEILAF